MSNTTGVVVRAAKERAHIVEAFHRHRNREKGTHFILFAELSSDASLIRFRFPPNRPCPGWFHSAVRASGNVIPAATDAPDDAGEWEPAFEKHIRLHGTPIPSSSSSSSIVHGRFRPARRVLFNGVNTSFCAIVSLRTEFDAKNA